jgi:hypothetical protein
MVDQADGHGGRQRRRKRALRAAEQLAAQDAERRRELVRAWLAGYWTAIGEARELLGLSDSSVRDRQKR